MHRFECRTAQIKQTIGELIEELRQLAYDSGYEDGCAAAEDDARSIARRTSSLSSVSSE